MRTESRVNDTITASFSPSFNFSNKRNKRDAVQQMSNDKTKRQKNNNTMETPKRQLRSSENSIVNMEEDPELQCTTTNYMALDQHRNQLTRLFYEDAIRIKKGTKLLLVLSISSYYYHQILHWYKGYIEFIKGYRHHIKHDNKIYLQVPVNIAATDGHKLLPFVHKQNRAKVVSQGGGLNITFLGETNRHYGGLVLKWKEYHSNEFFLYGDIEKHVIPKPFKALITLSEKQYTSNLITTDFIREIIEHIIKKKNSAHLINICCNN